MNKLVSARKMYIWLSSHPVLATISIGGGTVIACHLIWGAIKYMRNRLQVSGGEVLDVVILNELSECCVNIQINNPYSQPCDNPNCILNNIRNIVKYIDEAKYCIDFAMYTFTLIQVMDAFVRAQERGIRLRIITDEEMLTSAGTMMLLLKNFSFDIRVPHVKASIMHHKFMLIDGRNGVNEILSQKRDKMKPNPYCSIVLTGSNNWTLQAFGGNWENYVVSSDNIMTTTYETEFDRMWSLFKNV